MCVVNTLLKLLKMVPTLFMHNIKKERNKTGKIKVALNIKLSTN